MLRQFGRGETADLRHLLVASPVAMQASGASHSCPRVSQPAVVAESERASWCSTRIRCRRTPTGSAGAAGQFARALASCGRQRQRWIAPNFRSVYRHVFWGMSKSTTLSMQPSGRRPRSSRPPRSVPCFGPSAAGRGADPARAGRRHAATGFRLSEYAVHPAASSAGRCSGNRAVRRSTGSRALVKPEWHALLLDALTPTPLMQPGDTVFWHPDVVHAVNRWQRLGDPMYYRRNGAIPKNSAYLDKQAAAFMSGKTPPISRPTSLAGGGFGQLAVQQEADLTPFGRSQMGLRPL